MNRSALLCLTMVFLAACGPQNQVDSDENEIQAEGIVGAEEYSATDPGLKATVALLKNNSPFCTGTLIDSRIVLTAAHCVEDEYSGREITVRFGDGTKIQGDEFIKHHGYLQNSTEQGFFSISNKDSDDIAILSLTKPAPASAKIAKLPEGTLKVGQYKVRAFGLGVTSAKARGSGGIMRMVNLEGRVFPKRMKKMIFDQGNGKGLCKGDSGGPQFMYSNHEPIVVSLTTSLDKVAAFGGKPLGDMCRATAVATLTGPYLQWIAKGKKELLASVDGQVPGCLKNEEYLQRMAERFTLIDFSKGVRLVGGYRQGVDVYGAQIWIFNFVGIGRHTGNQAGGTASFTRRCGLKVVGAWGQ